MRFEPNEDQATFLSVVDQMTSSSQASWAVAPDWRRFAWSQTLDAELERNGFYDCALEETLGPVAATAMIFKLGTVPVTVECAASSMLRPLVDPQLPRPIAVIDHPGAVRFLPKAKTLLDISADRIRFVRIEGGDVEQVESLFAYPMGVLVGDLAGWTDADADAGAVRDRWRVALASEISGTLQGGLLAVLDHVRNRYQFGRPLGSFQAVQHRLAASATKIDAAYLLSLKAAQSGASADACLALGFVQNISTEIVYDLHQFMGAMGLTLEHPLHRWTYRARLLRSTFGGASENFGQFATQRWAAA
jgi:Acyl-CoA dehydrogenase, C-terminal domain